MSVFPRLGLRALVLFLAMALAAPALASSWHRHGRFELMAPSAPILAGDLLTLHSRRALSHRLVDRLRIRIGGAPADFYRVDRRTLRIVVPPGVSGRVGLRIVEKRRHKRRLLFRKRIELAATDIRTQGPSEPGPEFGLKFADPAGLKVGSPVEGWVRADGLTTVSTRSPVSVSGRITATTGAVVDLLLTGTASPETSDPPGSGADPRVTALDDTTLQVRIALDSGLASGIVTAPATKLPIDDVVIVGIDPPRGSLPSPKVASVSPNPVPAGGLVKITGSGFGDVQGRNRVVLGGRAVNVFPRVESWSDKAIEVTLPIFATGPYDLLVGNDIVPSHPIRVDVEPPCPNAKTFRATFEIGASSRANAVVPTSDCGFVIAGSTTSSKGDTDALLMRTDSEGNVLWQRTFGGGGFDEAHDVKALHHGFLFVGETSSKDLDARGRDVLVMRVSHMGIPVWTRVLGSPADEVGRGLTVHHEHNSQTASRVAIVGSTTANEAQSGMDALIYLMTTDGDVLAERQVQGEADDRFDDVTSSGRQGFVAVGRTRSLSLGAQEGGFDPLVVGFDAEGAGLFQRAVPVGRGDDFALSVEATPRGGFALAGQSRTAIGADDGFGAGGSLFLLEVDDAGNKLRLDEYDGRGQDVGVAGAFSDGDGGTVLAAFSDSSDFGATGLDPLLLKTSCDGALVDTRHPGASGDVERIFDAGRLPGDHFVVAGQVAIGTGSKVLLATEAAFADGAPVIEIFTGNEDTAARVRQGDPLTLRWRVRNADAIRIQRLGNNGPALDLDLPGGDLVDEIFDFASFSLDGRNRCESEGSCGDAVYRLTATTACSEVEAHVVVTVMPLSSSLSADEERLLEIESMVVQRFDQPNVGNMGDLVISRAVEECDGAGNCSLVVRVFGGSHPDSTVFPPQNICIGQSGFPYANPGAAGAAVTATIDDAEPALLSYANDGSIASWSYGRLLFTRGETTPPPGLPIPDSAWFGHYSGWHTGDGGMTVWGVDDTLFGGVPAPPPSPLLPACVAPPEFGGGPRPDMCGANPQPLIFHPSAWDTHFFRDLDGGGLIRVGRFANEVALSDPCIGAPIVGNDCETGDSPLTVPGTDDVISLFPFIDFETGTFIPTPCGG